MSLGELTSIEAKLENLVREFKQADQVADRLPRPPHAPRDLGFAEARDGRTAPPLTAPPRPGVRSSRAMFSIAARANAVMSSTSRTIAGTVDRPAKTDARQRASDQLIARADRAHDQRLQDGHRSVSREGRECLLPRIQADGTRRGP